MHPAQATTPQFSNPAALQAQIAEAQAEMAGLQAELSRVDVSLKQSQGGPSYMSLQARETELNINIARAQGTIARLNALAKAQGIPSGIPGGVPTTGVPRRFIDRVDPGMLIGLSFVLLLAFVLPLSIGLARRMLRGPARPSGDESVGSGSRLDRLEHAVDSIAIEVERISEGQRYVTKLLAETSGKAKVDSER